ncbi:O-antigen ligase family protein, partial [Halorhodospira sp. 9621]|uniref:O-antigen ligase family protein n=1 Tax=Halorhodospira sp. 9621 TaxID=2899135 RepID=UPI001EE9489E
FYRPPLSADRFTPRGRLLLSRFYRYRPPLNEMSSLTHTSTQKMPQNGLSAVLLLALFCLWINNIPFLTGENTGKQLATVGLIGCALIILLFFRPHLTLKGAIPFFFFAYLAYTTAVNYFVGLFNEPPLVFRDFADPVRIAGLLIFLLLGAASSLQVQPRHLRIFLYFYIGVTFALLFEWILSTPLVPHFFDLYITRGGRFSHTMTSVNYVWVTSLLALWAAFLLLLKREGLFDLPVISLTLALSILSLTLSGGRSAIVGFVAAFFVLLYFFLRHTEPRRLVAIFLSFALLITFSFAVFDLAVLERSINRLNELFSLLQVRNPAEVPALDARIAHWQTTWPIINDRLVFGHGSARAGTDIFDNTYLMTLYRYGLIGLALECLIFISMLGIAISRFHSHPGAPLALAFLLALLLNGITSTPMHELKTPYIFAFLAGWLCVTSPKCVFQTKVATDSRRSLPPIPRERCH